MQSLSKVLKKGLFVSLTTLASFSAQAKQNDLLDCLNPKDDATANLCDATESTSCEGAAAKAVTLLQEKLTGKKFEVSRVEVIQEDATYEVYYGYPSGPELVYTATVHVTTLPNSCMAAWIPADR